MAGAQRQLVPVLGREVKIGEDRLHSVYFCRVDEKSLAIVGNELLIHCLTRNLELIPAHVAGQYPGYVTRIFNVRDVKRHFVFLLKPSLAGAGR